MLTRRLSGALLAAFLVLAGLMPAHAQGGKKPITIGFGMALTGGLAPNGKAALLAMQMWEHDINAKGGLLGRPVKLIYYDDQSNPATVPGIYTKLLDVDHVDLVVSGYATNMIAPAMPIVMQHHRTFISLFGLAVNSEFHYDRYFAFIPAGGPHPKQSFTKGFFEVAMAAQSEAEDDRAGRCRRRVPAQRAGWRARLGEAVQPEGGVRPHLSAFDRRLHPDHPRDPGEASGPGAGVLLSAGQRRSWCVRRMRSG